MENKLQVKNLTISFRTSNGKVQAVRGVSFELFKGEGLTNAESDYILFEVDKTTGEFRSEDNRLQPETTYTYRAFVDLTGDKRVYSENSITFKTDRYDGDLVIPDAKKRQGDLEK